MDIDPSFVDPDNGDFHLKSQAGYFGPNGWVLDDVTSPCIDAGDPASPIGLDPSPWYAYKPKSYCLNLWDFYLPNWDHLKAWSTSASRTPC